VRDIINSILGADIDEMFTVPPFNQGMVKINEHACRGLFYATSVLSWGYLGNKEKYLPSFNQEMVKINEHACRGLFYATSVLSWGYLGNKEKAELRYNPEESYITLEVLQKAPCCARLKYICQTLLQM
jgi:hypothetical protein